MKKVNQGWELELEKEIERGGVDIGHQAKGCQG